MITVRTSRMTAVFAALALTGMAFAQAPPLVLANASNACRIALPYQSEKFSDCTPQLAAAYDFAFCSLNYRIAALSAPSSDKALGEKSKSEAYNSAGITYGTISQALSDADTYQKNTELAKNFFESLKEKSSDLRDAIDYVYEKCNNVEAHHAQVLEQLIAKLKQKSQSGR